MTEKTLFIGNGLNRTLNNGMAWGDLMARLGAHAHNRIDAPFPIEYEAIAAQLGGQLGYFGDPYKDLRSKIADLSAEQMLEPYAVHQRYRDLPFDHFVTTNYDTVFESMYSNNVQAIANIGSTRNILTAVSKNDRVDFYHAHGVAKWKNTICLGHDHYASLIGKIRKEFQIRDDNNYSYLSSVILKMRESTKTWPEYLFTNDVAIVGLSLDYCEIDLWWLLSLRAAIFAPCNGIKSEANCIVYFAIDGHGNCDSGTHSAKYDVLERLGVEVVRIPQNDYDRGYIEIADTLKARWS